MLTVIKSALREIAPFASLFLTKLWGPRRDVDVTLGGGRNGCEIKCARKAKRDRSERTKTGKVYGQRVSVECDQIDAKHPWPWSRKILEIEPATWPNTDIIGKR